MNFLEMFQTHFLLHNALWGSIAVGLFCPLIGVYFMLRRMVLLGVALPQISAAGIALAFYLQGMGLTWSPHPGEANDKILALVGSVVLTLVAIAALAALERRREGTSESRIGATFAMAYAASILLVSANPFGKIELLQMLHGEIVVVTPRDLHILLGVFGVLGASLLLFNRQFLLVSFDRDSAQVMGKNVLAWDALLFGMIGVALSISVLIVGPMLTFAYLIIPPLAARRFCSKIHTFFILSALLGGLSAVGGFYVSYRFDWPLGPTEIMAVSIVLLGAFLSKKVSS
jgi:ABC-type Mn2+/Zn2+ transport system permease subunit